MEQPPSGLSEHKAAHRTLVGACGLVILLLLAAFSWTLVVFNYNNQSRSNQCKLVDELTLTHVINQQEQIRVPSDDFRSLVKFVGSIEYPSEEEHNNGNATSHNSSRPNHLALKLNSIEFKPNASDSSQILVLETNCARIILNLASDTRQLLVGSIELETVQVGSYWRACQVSSTEIKLDDVASRRYSSKCSRRDQTMPSMRYECKRGLWRDPSTFVERPVAKLHIHSFEFELDGQPESIRQNAFSKPQMEC